MQELNNLTVKQLLSTLHQRAILGIDYGTKRIGVAVTDPLLLSAKPVATLVQGSQFWDQLRAMCSDYCVGAVVVGIPRWDRGRISKIEPLVQQFAIALERKLSLPVWGYDESLTTVRAERWMREQPVTRATRVAGVDALAAALLLHDVLEMVAIAKRTQER